MLYSINPVIYIINVRVIPEGKEAIGEVLRGIINTIGLGVVVEPPVLVQAVGFIETAQQPGYCGPLSAFCTERTFLIPLQPFVDVGGLVLVALCFRVAKRGFVLQTILLTLTKAGVQERRGRA